MATENEDFTEFERQLTALSPRTSSVDREELMFHAGRESALSNRPTAANATWLWPLSTAALAIASIGLSWQLYVQAEPAVIERVRIVERENVAEPSMLPVARHVVTNEQQPLTSEARESSEPAHYLRYRELALATGMDAWSTPISGESFESNAGASYRDMRVTYTTLPTTEATEETPLQTTKDETDLGDKS